MYIKEICLEGFKSYASRTLVPGFDPFFNSITGLNGCGKSNILDSICFVLGITNLQQVRVANLQELVYKQGQAGITEAPVSIIFDNSDRSRSPLGYEDHSEITVTRQIVVGGRNKYLINGKLAQPSQVQNLFHSVQLNVNNPYFVIMQGRITKVLNMKPPEILSMLEEASGTRMYETKKEFVLKTLDKKQSKVDEINKLLDEEILPALEKLRKERMQYVQWSNGNVELDRLKRFCVAYDYVEAKRIRDSAVGEVQRLKAKVTEIDNDTERVKVEIQDMETNISKLTAEKEANLGGKVKALSDEVDSLSKKLVQEVSVLNSKEDTLKGEKENAEKIIHYIEVLKQSIEEKAVAVQKSKEGLADLKKRVGDLSKSFKEHEKEYQAIVAGKSSGNEEKCLADQLGDAKVAVGAAETELKQLRTKISHCGKELEEKRHQLMSKRDEALEVENELNSRRKDVEKVKIELESLPHKEDQMETLQKDCAIELELIQKLKDTVQDLSAQLANVQFTYCDPVKKFDRSKVKGVVVKLIKVKDSSAMAALEVTAGGKLFNVVVDTENTGKQLLQNGDLRRRVTIIPLNKIQPSTVHPRVHQAAMKLVGKENAKLALSLVGYDEELESAMEYVFGATFVYKTTDAAKEACPSECFYMWFFKQCETIHYSLIWLELMSKFYLYLSPENNINCQFMYGFFSFQLNVLQVAFNREIRTPSVTLEGDIFQPSGLLTGGSRRGGGDLLRQLHDLAECESKLAGHQKRLSEIKMKIADLQPLQKRFMHLKAQLELKMHDLSLFQNRAEKNEYLKLAEMIKNIEQELVVANSAVKEKQTLYEKHVSAILQLEKSIRDHENNREGRLKTLKRKIKATKSQLLLASKDLKEHENEIEMLVMEREAVKQEQSSLESQLASLRTQIYNLNLEVEEELAKVDTLNKNHDQLQSELDSIRLKSKECDFQISSFIKEQQKLQLKLSDIKLERKRLDNEVKQTEREQKDCSMKVDKLIEKHAWVATERQFFGKGGTDYDFASCDPLKTREELDKLQAEQSSLGKRVNKKVVAMFEKAEDEYNNLMSKKNTVENDKSKIKKTLEELDEKKKETLKVTLVKVNKDFGSIFSTLLPGAMAKLEPPEGCSFLDGLEARVAFGGVWKQSLSELSGGQKSLLALSLILALLLFNPAPFYILDEFIVVSLKEGMFNNANVLFRTKFVDGVSTVQRTVASKAEQVISSATYNRRKKW
ncbi:structural maintenance of chromosomes protein 2-1 isoform X2 [Gossypium hirsutum]|uniref:Structural maintenance of chromosomes protein n=1 Tax=Gossypium hirsutum TaxID=3635 RepID=A0A1U8NZV3_GOSHI|nr:structural maintenance of chromosomes protein 2-1-like isoform X2 [Gossypium hirsutum]